MTTARDMIARKLHDLDDLGYGMTRCFDVADQQIAALLSAPEPVRLELAALLNPWRPISEAPQDQRSILAVHKNSGIQMVSFRQSIGSAEYEHGCGPEEIWTPTHFVRLPAPPSEDKA